MERTLQVFITNLKILAKLEAGDKLTSNGFNYGISAKQRFFGDSIIRTITGDSGKVTIDILTHDFDTIYMIADLIFSSLQSVTEEVSTQRLNLLSSLHNAITQSITGLDELCGTYANDALIRHGIRDLFHTIETRQKWFRDMLLERKCELSTDVVERKYV